MYVEVWFAAEQALSRFLCQCEGAQFFLVVFLFLLFEGNERSEGCLNTLLAYHL